MGVIYNFDKSILAEVDGREPLLLYLLKHIKGTLQF